MDKIIFATKNKNKIEEINEILRDTEFQVISMEEAGINIDVEETGITFEENAILKSKAIAKVSGTIVLSDDSGIEIDYLDKAPGVYSARFLGEDTPYDTKNKHIIQLLEGIPDEKRTARFVSVIAATLPSGETFTTRGTIEGLVGYEQAGENGFGYDPIFFVPEYNMTTAQMSRDQKNAISHRGKALRAMKKELINHLLK